MRQPFHPPSSKKIQRCLRPLSGPFFSPLQHSLLGPSVGLVQYVKLHSFIADSLLASAAARIIFSTNFAGLAASLMASSGSSASPAACLVFSPKLALLAVTIVTARRIPAKTVKFIFA